MPWWLDSHSNNDETTIRRSPWLSSAIAELDKKTQSMLRIIEEDADSFAQRAEMYYKKRPELITMVGDFYQAHRSLAEKYDQLKSDPIFRHITPWSSSPLSSNNQQKKQSITCSEKSYDSWSETTYDPMEACGSDVDDPEQDDQIHQKLMKEEKIVISDEMVKLRGEVERLKSENRIQKERLEDKDEEKREVIRHLNIVIDVLKGENVKLRKRFVTRETPNKANLYEFHKVKDMFMGKFLKGSSRAGARVSEAMGLHQNETSFI